MAVAAAPRPGGNGDGPRLRKVSGAHATRLGNVEERGQSGLGTIISRRLFGLD